MLLPLLLVQFALYGVADISLTTDDSVSLWIVSIPIFVYSVESHHFLSALIERLEGAERHGHPSPEIGALLRDLPVGPIVLGRHAVHRCCSSPAWLRSSFPVSSPAPSSCS